MKERYVAIVLAAGQGKRMNTQVQKQYIQMNNKPLLYYSLQVFQESIVDEVVLVVGEGQIAYCQKEIIEKYHLTKVTCIVEGGKERYHSVYQGILAIKECSYLLIHDGARPFVTQDMIGRTIEGAKKHRACVAGMPAKDTIKIVDQEQCAIETPNRNRLWLIQTPQVFVFPLIKEGYEKLMECEDATITDDAMVIEKVLGKRVYLVQGDYRNIKVTTPEDLIFAEALLKE